MSEDAAGAPPGQPTAAKASSDVFISYASQDKAVANAVCKHLESAGLACWIAPRDVTPGEFYAESIVHAIDSAKVAVLILSQHTTDSQHVFREIERATSKRRHVITLRTDTAPLPTGLEYFLNTSQWLDASAMGVHRALPKLLDAVRSAIAQSPATVRDDPGRSTTTRMSQRQRAILFALAALVVVALGYVMVDKLWLSNRVDEQNASVEATATSPEKSSTSLAISDKSVAVLPFVDMSEKKDQEYMADGIAEELLNLLAQVPEPDGDRPHVLVCLQGPEHRDRGDRRETERCLCSRG